MTGSGGGYGSPRRRDPSAVFEDVLDGYLSTDMARNLYGVALGGDPLAIDEAETARLREGNGRAPSAKG